MNAKEQQRLVVVNQLIGREFTGQRAGMLMELSVRQVRRLLAAYRREGAAALAHGNRGRAPVHALPAAVKVRVVEAAQTVYAGCNWSHLRDLLAEDQGLGLSRSSVWRVLRAAGMQAPRQGRRQHRCRRQRMPQEGVLLQMDGSHHPWLEDRGPQLTLLLAIDDATGVPPYALFREEEDTEGYFLLLKSIIERRGIPLGLYTDRHTVFRPTRPAPGAADAEQEREPTQFGRALKELGITPVFAQSPGAKGRIERANGTFQDRLVAELRLAGAATREEADRVLWRFLPRYSARFGVPAAQPGSAYRPLPESFDLDSVLCFKEWRRVARDNTVQYHGRVLQLFPDAERPSYVGARVEVQERLDGRVLVSYRGKLLTPQDAPPLAATLRAQAQAVAALPPVEWEDLYPPAPARQRRPRAPVVPGPLAGDTIWYEDPVRKNKHRELVRAGMERARQEGKRIGRPRVVEREGFTEQFAAVVERLGQGTLSRRQAARDLGIGYATLKRLMDAHLAALQQGGIGPEEPEKTPSFAPVEDRLVSPYDPNRSEGVRAAFRCADYVAPIGGVTFSLKP